MFLISLLNYRSICQICQVSVSQANRELVVGAGEKQGVFQVPVSEVFQAPGTVWT